MNDRITKARALRRAVQLWCGTLSDESVMLEVAALYPLWRDKTAYRAGAVVRCGLDENGEPRLWRVLQDHTSQAGWEPENAPSLFRRVGMDGELPLWTQPLGASDAYEQGDRVSHLGRVWVSVCGGNVWEPGVYGWESGEDA